MKQPDLARFDPKYKVKPEEVHMQGLPAIENSPTPGQCDLSQYPGNNENG